MNSFLNPIAVYCRDNNLPIITVLVVSVTTGLPGGGSEGFVSSERVAEEQERIYKKNWHLIIPPTARDFGDVGNV